MAQKFDADLNIIQRSNIEIQIDQLSKDLNIIQKLDDEPNDVGGLSAQELKAKFDEAGNTIKGYINETLIPQVLSEGATEKQREQQELVRQENEAQRQSNEQVRQSNEAAREETEAARNVWEDYNPEKAYVPGNKVYWAGSSYVNKTACTGVPPNVAANWQMVAKKGADSDEGMSQDDADARYLQLSGGWMTGQMSVLDPDLPGSPTPKGYVQPSGIQIARIPDKRTYSLGERIDTDGMKVEASYVTGAPVRVTGWRLDEEIIRYDMDRVTVRYMENHAERTAELTLKMVPSGIFDAGTLPVTQRWYLPVYGGGVWVMAPYAHADMGVASVAAYSEDGGKTWKSANLTVGTKRKPPVYKNGIWLLSDAGYSNRVEISVDGKTWESSFFPIVNSPQWWPPVYGGGLWATFFQGTVSSSSDPSQTAAYSEDGGKTWNMATLPAPRVWIGCHYVGGMFFSFATTPTQTMAYSEDGKTWGLTAWTGTPVTMDTSDIFYGGGTWILLNWAASAIFYSKDGKNWVEATIAFTISGADRWTAPVYGGGVWVVSLDPSTKSTNRVLYSEDGGATWEAAVLPRNIYWSPPVYADGAWVMVPYNTASNGPDSVFTAAAHSEDGKTWFSSTLPLGQRWTNPVYGGGVWFLGPAAYSDQAAYSEDGGKTWIPTTIPTHGPLAVPAFADGVWFIAPTSGDAAYSEDGCKTWTAAPHSNSGGYLVYEGGVWFMSGELSADDTIKSSNSINCMSTFKRMADPDGTGDKSTEAPAPTLASRLAALETENAALAAAVERGLSL